MAKAFGEWLRDNPGGTRAGHEEYLSLLAQDAAPAAMGLMLAPAHPGTAVAYTREQVSAALNAAAGLLSEHEGESSETIRQDDIVNLAVNGTLHLLDHPGASLDEIIVAQYAGLDIDDYDLDEGEEMPEKGSPRWNELVIARVKGWADLC